MDFLWKKKGNARAWRAPTQDESPGGLAFYRVKLPDGQWFETADRGEALIVSLLAGLYE